LVELPYEPNMGFTFPGMESAHCHHSAPSLFESSLSAGAAGTAIKNPSAIAARANERLLFVLIPVLPIFFVHMLSSCGYWPEFFRNSRFA
jgi:hypothetical protein